MKQYGLVLFASASLLSITACHKAAPLAAVPALAPAPAPAPAAKPKPAPAAVAARPTATAPAARPAPAAKMSAQERETLNQRLAKLSDALFDYDQSTIRPDAMTALKGDVEVIRGILANYPAQKLVIEGHADARGSAEYNLGLGDKRGNSAQTFLADMGIPRQQLEVVSFGKERPACTDATEACYQQNRRIHITAAP